MTTRRANEPHGPADATSRADETQLSSATATARRHRLIRLIARLIAQDMTEADKNEETDKC